MSQIQSSCSGRVEDKSINTADGVSTLTSTTSNDDQSRRREEVQEYYGKVLKGTTDLKTNICTNGLSQQSLASVQYGATIRRILKDIHPEVVDKYYGCGVQIPDCLDGTSVLDIGCGSGRDCYLLSKLVGEAGQVTGIDMTDEQLETARKFVQYHADKFGYKTTNVDFVQGFMEDLDRVGIPSDHYDLIVSNCVVNLSPDKTRVLQQIYRSLKSLSCNFQRKWTRKDGGEFYFSDIYADRRISKELQDDKTLWGECLSGALYWKDFFHLAAQVGFSEPRLVRRQRTDVGNQAINSRLGEVRLVTATYRLLKLPNLASPEAAQCVVYLGTVEGFPQSLPFDSRNEFKVGVATKVDEDAIVFLCTSRYRRHFQFVDVGDCENESTLKSVTKRDPTNPFDGF